MLYGVLFGVMWGSFDFDHRDSVRERVLIGVIAGVLFGLVLGWVTRGAHDVRRQRTAAFTSGFTEERRRLAERASRRGPVPDDPQTRAAAAALARYRLEGVIRLRTAGLVSLGLVTLAWVFLAMTRPLGWLVVLALVGMFVFLVLQPRMVRDRLALLERDNVLGG